jgi:protein arginine N-methyltransferase 1
MYNLHDYARMIADDVRTGAYVRALEATVRPGSVVVDIGTGTGICALVACRLGARRVYAIEPNDAIEVGRELAVENGCADRIEFIHDDALRVKLPERADVIVSDLRGGMPSGAVVMAHAREHFLAPAGILVPTHDVLHVAVVGSAALHERAVGPAATAGVTLHAMRHRLSNTVHKDRSRSIRPADLLTAGAAWATLDYASIAADPIRGHAEWLAAREAPGHGLLLWFDAVLADGIGFSSAPGQDVVHPQLFLPWPEPVAIHEGDRIAVDLWCQPEGESWGWNTRVSGTDGTHRAQLKQSTFLAELSPPRPVTDRALRSQREAS